MPLSHKFPSASKCCLFVTSHRSRGSGFDCTGAPPVDIFICRQADGFLRGDDMVHRHQTFPTRTHHSVRGIPLRCFANFCLHFLCLLQWSVGVHFDTLATTFPVASHSHSSAGQGEWPLLRMWRREGVGLTISVASPECIFKVDPLHPTW